MEETSLLRVLRASLAARSMYAEDELHRSVKRGIRRYVVLGAGLDKRDCFRLHDLAVTAGSI